MSFTLVANSFISSISIINIMKGGNKMKLKEAIEVLKDLKRLSTIPMTLREGIDTILLNKAIDTVVNEVEKPPITERDMHLNMQYYMEYCQMKGYVTPMEWLEKHKHFGKEASTRDKSLPDFELQFCNTFLQMTNHLAGKCQKCK